MKGLALGLDHAARTSYLAKQRQDVSSVIAAWAYRAVPTKGLLVNSHPLLRCPAEVVMCNTPGPCEPARSGALYFGIQV